MNEIERSKILPMLALRGLVLFPKMVLHFDVGRKKSALALNESVSREQLIFLTAQKDIDEDDPSADGLYSIGCIASVKQVIKVSEDNIRVIVEGVCRARLIETIRSEPSFVAEVLPVVDKNTRNDELYKKSLLRYTKKIFDSYASLSGKLSPDIIMGVISGDDCGSLADFIASNINIDVFSKQQILAELNPVKRLEILCAVLESECDILSVEHKIGEKVKERIDENQRDFYLREQLKVISEELGDYDSPQDEAEDYRDKIFALPLSDDIREKLLKETDKLFKMPSGSHEATVVRNYLDTCIELPWGKFSKERTDVGAARKILDREHYSMTKVKERILEIIAVRALDSSLKGQIICLSGPPGVGKTSIARSLAKCMNRKYARISLGGVRDESDIRGHRKTYIGAMPGRIMSAVKTAGTCNPLILLDEIDKLGSDYRGDPSAALLEALDSEQNNAFVDHYLDLPFDLSNVVFVTTANNPENIPAPLFDRMDVIDLSSYTREDKFNIAKRHLIKKQLKANGLTASRCKITDGAVYGLIDHYTREAGVRGLEKRLAAICRKCAMLIADGETVKVTVKADDLVRFLGPHKFKRDDNIGMGEVGTVNGLAWTSVGGEMLPIEAVTMPGTGKVTLTGSLGDVMKESATAAISYIRWISDTLEITDSEFYKNSDIHIHAPEGAVPKDGPSAGVTMTTALVSELTGIPVCGDIAMTGEISLRGKVMPIGGLKEKSMAAYRAGIKRVLIPAENLPDIDEVDERVKSSVEFIPVKRIDEVLKLALSRNPFKTEAAKRTVVLSDEKGKKSASSRVPQ